MDKHILKLANEAGITATIRPGTVEMLSEETLEAFARLIAADIASMRNPRIPRDMDQTGCDDHFDLFRKAIKARYKVE